jgi:hypothetical protein
LQLQATNSDKFKSKMSFAVEQPEEGEIIDGSENGEEEIIYSKQQGYKIIQVFCCSF